jgi:protein involved in polysaccharide export with SLBB domain
MHSASAFRLTRLTVPLVVCLLLGSCVTSKNVPAARHEVTDGFATAWVESTPSEVESFQAGSSDPYLIGPSDVLVLRSAAGEFPDEQLKVTPEGRVNVNRVGWVAVGHMDLPAAEISLTSALKKFYSDGTARLVPFATPSRTITVLGSVRTPAVQLVDGDLTLVEALARAGGIEATPGDRRLPTSVKVFCRVVRVDSPGVLIDLRRVLFGSDALFNVKLKSGDILYVYKP